MGTLDLRAGSLNVQSYPGNEHTVAMTWPAGALAGTTWVAALDGDAVTIDAVGDVLTLTFTTPSTEGVYELVITQTNVTPNAARIVGLVHAFKSPSLEPSATTVTVVEDEASIDVSVVGVLTGSGAGAAFVHSQPTPAASVEITHNLGFHPNVTVIETGTGAVVDTDISYGSTIALTLTFAAPTAFTAYLS